MGRFKKGLFLGGVLGAALMWLTVTKEGKEAKEQMLGWAADVYSDLKKKVMASDAWQTMSESKYVALATELVNTYAIENGLAQKAKDMVLKIVKLQWRRLEEELRARGERTVQPGQPR